MTGSPRASSAGSGTRRTGSRRPSGSRRSEDDAVEVCQVWYCPACGYTYESPIRVIAMACPGPHKPYGQRVMALAESTIDGEAVSTVPAGKGGASRG
jgi:hypothetical protein